MRDWSNKMCSQWEGFLERAIIIKLGSYYTLIVELDPEEEVQKIHFFVVAVVSHKIDMKWIWKKSLVLDKDWP